MSNEVAKTGYRAGDPALTDPMVDFYREVMCLLKEQSVPYAVAGAFALREHTGICRVTKDLDLFLTAENMCRSVELLRARGYDCEVRDAVWLSKVVRDPIFIDLITGMSNAVFSVDDEWIERATRANVLGVDTRVLAPEELIVAKLFVSRRERFDGADIAHIIYHCRNLDWARVLDLVGDHWGMLLWSLLLFRYVYPGQNSRVPADVWELLLSKLINELGNPTTTATFRGSLVDENMFAVDVENWGLPNLYAEYRAQRLENLEPLFARCGLSVDTA